MAIKQCILYDRIFGAALASIAILLTGSPYVILFIEKYALIFGALAGIGTLLITMVNSALQLIDRFYSHD